MINMIALLTSGAGYIGSRSNVELIGADFDIVILNDFSNSKAESLARVG